jgi:plasmid stabilization system protein ParE
VIEKVQVDLSTLRNWEKASTDGAGEGAARPAIGQECSDIRAGYYKISCGSHLPFYRLIAEGIDIVRILHERMDFARHIP